MHPKILQRPGMLKIGDKLTSLEIPKIMGILNVTPDSFYDGGRYLGENEIKLQLSKLLNDGADIIDVGGYSSRPGAEHISVKEEMSRVSSCLKVVRKYFPETVLSVDTFRSDVAEMAIKDYKVPIINDISGGELDAGMVNVLSANKVTYVMMHMQGNPQNMQTNPNYSNVTVEVIQHLQKKVLALHQAGVHDIIIDPGFGFGKTVEQNYALLSQLKMFNLLSKPILVGISRKSMLYKPLGIPVEDALNITSIGHVLALSGGANILRVHDVKEAKQCVDVMQLAKREIKQV